MKFTNVPLVLESQAPIASNGSEYNKLYLLGVVGAVIGIVTIGPGAILTALMGLIFGHLLKKVILQFKCKELRKIVRFSLHSKVPYNILAAELTAVLSPLGMIVETDKNGVPVITHNKIIFDIIYNEDSTFTIWWRKSLVKAIISDDYIKLYRNCVVSMGIIGYHIQQISKNYSDNQTSIRTEF